MTDKEQITKLFNKINIALDDVTPSKNYINDKCKSILEIKEDNKIAYYGARFYFSKEGELIDFDATV